MKVVSFMTSISTQPEQAENQNDNLGPLQGPTGYGAIGPGELDYYASENYVTGLKDQPISRLFQRRRINQAISVSLTTVTNFQVDFPVLPDYYVVCFSTTGNIGASHVFRILVSETLAFRNADTILSQAGADLSSDMHRLVIPATSQHLFFQIEFFTGSASSVGVIEGTVYAISGLDPSCIGAT